MEKYRSIIYLRTSKIRLKNIPGLDPGCKKSQGANLKVNFEFIFKSKHLIKNSLPNKVSICELIVFKLGVLNILTNPFSKVHTFLELFVRFNSHRSLKYTVIN